ncbi:hypothetical protein [Tolypothrix sp. PCC 7601]|uniref:hypothetical protein n=1 Tax=Tolypothrix sp. PCC 7601 TaxID=1188 RepID=UPI0021E02481|nr:hypothetical protein [Tolypothrix sp. PCC 7601]UYD38975.1 hypothetical protein HG267_41545 [Tolypothrix sp. PCC 7601]
MYAETIAVNPNNEPVSIRLDFQTVSIALSAAVSLSVLIGLIIKLVSKFDSITGDIKDLREDLDKININLADIKTIQKDIINLDKRHDLHVQDYLNRVEAVNLITRQLNEKIDHKFGRTAASIKDIEQFLAGQGLFKIRETDYSLPQRD